MKNGESLSTNWRRPLGRPRKTWIQQIGNGTPASWRQMWQSADEGGHRGESSPRTAAVYASWWWWWWAVARPPIFGLFSTLCHYRPIPLINESILQSIVYFFYSDHLSLHGRAEFPDLFWLLWTGRLMMIDDGCKLTGLTMHQRHQQLVN